MVTVSAQSIISKWIFCCSGHLDVTSMSSLDIHHQRPNLSNLSWKSSPPLSRHNRPWCSYWTIHQIPLGPLGTWESDWRFKILICREVRHRWIHVPVHCHICCSLPKIKEDWGWKRIKEFYLVSSGFLLNFRDRIFVESLIKCGPGGLMLVFGSTSKESEYFSICSEKVRKLTLKRARSRT